MPKIMLMLRKIDIAERFLGPQPCGAELCDVREADPLVTIAKCGRSDSQTIDSVMDLKANIVCSSSSSSQMR